MCFIYVFYLQKIRIFYTLNVYLKINGMEHSNKIILFQEKQIRRIWEEGRWWFSIIDTLEVLTDSVAPSKYWTKLKTQLEKERAVQLSTISRKFKFTAVDGKQRATDCADTEGMLRIIMSVPSPKAEPFKLWLAQVGKERIEEIENPELALERVKEIYKAKGYSEEWIQSRIKSIGIRKELTDEWKGRGVQEGQEYSILTAEIAKATFGLTPTEHKKLKNLENQNLRDHMTNMELIFTMLGEESTRQIAVKTAAQGFEENHEAAQRGGRAAGKARLNIERETGNPVVSSDNFLKQIEEAEKSKGLSKNNEIDNGV
jgi:DNA-damage-inducible protein D